MKAIASISGGWCVEAGVVQCNGDTLVVYPLGFEARPRQHQLPNTMSFRDVIEDMNRCQTAIYILPERNPSNE